ncbi:MAG: hypothetical protein ACF8XB_18610 [Planctomycetota bacterium JB042]
MNTKCTDKRKHQPIPSPKTGTRAAEAYFSVYTEVDLFFNWFLHLVGSAQSIQEALGEARVIAADTPEEKREWKRRAKDAAKPFDELRRQRQLLMEIVLVRQVEAYLNYLADLLFEIFTQRPETLLSSDEVKVSDVLQHRTIADVVHELAKRKVNSLSYRSLDELGEFFEKRFRLQIAPSESLITIRDGVETRNISVHNRCVVNEIYIRRTAGDPAQVGKLRSVTATDYDEITEAMFNSVKSTDKQARTRLKLKGVRFEPDRDARRKKVRAVR